MGEGIRRIFSSLRHHDLVDPQLTNSHDNFSVTLFHRSVFSQDDIRWLKEFDDFGLSKDEQRVVLLGKDGHLLSTTEIMQSLSIIDTEEFRALHEKLSMKGVLYSAVKRSGGGKRNKPRFKVRQPHEAQECLNQLNDAIKTSGRWEKLDKETESALKKVLPNDNPYSRNIRKSLRLLELVNEQNQPTDRLKGIWIATATDNVAQNDEQSDGESKTTVNAIVERKGGTGFGFATASDGTEYFIHTSQFLHPEDWRRVKRGVEIQFEVGERRIANKPRPAKNIRIIEA